jgi:cysteine desulfurase
LKAYLDWNATTPPLDEVVEAMAECMRKAWGNASSVHSVGRLARKVVEDARESVASAAGADPRDLIFTSGGTEANNMAIRSLCGDGAALITSRLEHPSVVKVAEQLEAQGLVVRWLRVDATGVISAQAVDAALASVPSPERALVVTHAVNHETGVIQPISAIGEVTHERGARLHVDAVQAFGKAESRLFRAADTLTLAAHKIRGPKGIGALVVRHCTNVRPILIGGAQERGLRPGTQSPALCAGFAVAVKWASGASRWANAKAMRDSIEAALVAMGGSVNGGEPRVGHVSNVSFVGRRGDELVAALDVEGVCVSSGSACSAGTAEHSPVIEAMMGLERAKSSVRISLGPTTTAAEVDGAVGAFAAVLAR